MRKAIEITLSVSKCLQCKACPQPALAEAYKSPKRMMSDEDFKTIVDKVPADCEFHYSGFSETMLHPNFAEYFKYTDWKGLRVHLFSTLVGLNERKAEAIAKSNVEYIRIHLPNKSEFIFDETRWLKLLDLFLTTGKPFSAMSLADLDPDFQHELSKRGVTVERPQVLSRAGSLGWHAEGRPLKGPITCQARRHHMNECLPNGDVYICSHDWNLLMPVGNLLEQSYDEIYASAEKYRLNLTPPETSPCFSCEWARPAAAGDPLD